MSQLADKFFDRSPRYVLRADDNKNLKFAIDSDKSRIFSTQLINLSLTGLAFVALAEHSPRLNDLIKFEFVIPGGEQIAWWGKVVRIEDYRINRPWKSDSEDSFKVKEKLIAVNFQSVPEKMRSVIHKGLLEKIKKNQRRKIFEKLSQIKIDPAHFEFIKLHRNKIIFFLLSSLLTFFLLYLLTQPFGNYSSDRGAPWGQRFK
jgi:hypothetical protein